MIVTALSAEQTGSGSISGLAMDRTKLPRRPGLGPDLRKRALAPLLESRRSIQPTEGARVEKGWRAGYEAAFNEVMGRVGAPAGRGDEDELLPPC